MKPLTRTIVGLQLLLTALGPALAVNSDEASWTIAPADNDRGAGRSNYVYTVDPGAVIEDAFVVVNTGVQPLTLSVATADGFTTSSGALDLLPLAEPSTGVGAWAQSSVDEVTIEPKELVEIPFVLQVPADATPGDHTGGIVTVLESVADRNLSVEHRLGTRIHVRVAGAQTVQTVVENAEVAHKPAYLPTPTDVTVGYDLRNTGNVRTAYTERVIIEGPFGLARTELVSMVDEVLPRNGIRRQTEVPRVWLLGPTTVTIEVSPQAIDGALGPQVSVTASTMSIPWFVVLIVLAIAAFIAVRAARKAKQPHRSAVPISEET